MNNEEKRMSGIKIMARLIKILKPLTPIMMITITFGVLGFLAATAGVELSVFFQRKLGAGLVGGEGFVMQRLSGQGIAFVEIDGYACEYDLAPGQSMIVDTGYLAMMDATCQMEAITVKGVKNALFGGEGFFNTKVTGPGRITLQTMPIITVAGSIRPYIPTGN